jgi:hypothetical protein
MLGVQQGLLRVPVSKPKKEGAQEGPLLGFVSVELSENGFTD